jgi:hypothetical protein
VNHPPPRLPPLLGPLRAIFWGALLCLFDFTVSETSGDEGWRFDFLNDFVGMLTIAWAVFRLSAVEVDERYRIALGFVKMVAVFGCMVALHRHAIYDVPSLISLLEDLYGFLAMAATVIFCVAMQWLSRHGGLSRSEQSWRFTTLLFIVIYLLPLGLFHLASLAATLTGESFHLDLGPAGLIALPVFFIPLLHFFISTSRMRDEAMTADLA